MRRGFTTHELLVSLTVTAAVLALATQFALGQMRFFRDAARLADGRLQLGPAGEILGSALVGISPAAGDLIVAEDTAVEFRMTIGTAVTCDTGTGRLLVPLPAARHGNTLSSFSRPPAAGDLAHVLVTDSLGATWLASTVREPPATAPPCGSTPRLEPAWTVALSTPMRVPASAVVRFTRPMRFSLYRGSDGHWYLGGRDWNAGQGRFNGVQPVAGPLEPYSPDSSRTGLRFTYVGADGEPLATPVDARGVAAIAVMLRAEPAAALRTGATERPDSATIVVALRNGG